MQNYHRPQSNTFLAIILIAAGCFVPVQPASAQLVELATEAINTLNSIGQQGQQSSASQSPTSVSPPQPFPWGNGKFHLGTDNLSGNTINLCISGCILPSEPVIEAIPENSRTHLPIDFERL